MKNTKLTAWKRYFTVAIKDLKVTSNKEVQKDIQNNIIKKLNKCKEMFNNEELQEILVLFTESTQGQKKIEKHNFNKDTFTEMKVVVTDFTKLGGDKEIKTSLHMINRNNAKTFISTLRISL